MAESLSANKLDYRRSYCRFRGEGVELLVIGIMLAASTGAWARHSAQAALTVVDACLNPAGTGPVMDYARALAASVFLQANIRLVWHNDQRPCRSAVRAVVIGVSLDTSEDDHPGALAYAMPLEGARGVIFFDRIGRITTPPVIPRILAFVLVHEITHLLQKGRAGILPPAS